MGLFSGKSTTVVSSVVYNLAGDEQKRPGYLKTTVLGAIVSKTDTSLGRTIVDSYLSGPAITLRNFTNWAQVSGYNSAIGIVSGDSSLNFNIDKDQIITQLGGSLLIQQADIGVPDYMYWAEQYMFLNHPADINLEWIADFNADTYTVSISLPGSYAESFYAEGYDPAKRYLYITFNRTQSQILGPLIEGSTIPLGSEDSFPDTEGWTLKSTTDTITIWERTTYQGLDIDSGRNYSLFERMTFNTSPRTYKIDNQKIIQQVWEPTEITIYPEDTGNTVFDSMFGATTASGSFYPPIPIRVDNHFVNPDDYLTEVYPLAKKALKRSINGDFDDVVSKISDNASLGDIDYAYAVFGVALNVKDASSKRYIYEFFKRFGLASGNQDTAYPAWKIQWQAARDSWDVWYAAKLANADQDVQVPIPDPLPFPTPPNYDIRISTANRAIINFDMTISWSGIRETISTSSTQKKGAFWFTTLADEAFYQKYFTEDGLSSDALAYGITHVQLNWQYDTNVVHTIDLWGLAHTNMIYGGKGVYTSAGDALADTDESGFIIPLHEQVFSDMPLSKATQTGVAATFLVFNCYEVVKQKWYQTGVFQIFLVVAVIVVAVYSGGITAGSTGLLGTAGGVGATLGFTGTAAIVAGAAANAFAAMIVMSVFQQVGSGIFGSKIGPIIGTIASLVAIQAGTTYINGTSMVPVWSEFAKADNILKLSSSLGNAYAQYLKASAAEVMADTKSLSDDYAKQSKAVSDAYDTAFGIGGTASVFDPMTLTDATTTILESSDSFLTRTVLTGSDVVEMSQSLITNFVDISLNLDLPS